MEWIDRYKCNLCGCVWNHKWDTEDYNNDFTSCPECDECDFDEVGGGVDISPTQYVTSLTRPSIKTPI